MQGFLRCSFFGLAAVWSLASPTRAQPITEYIVGVPPTEYPNGITLGPDGALWISDAGNGDCNPSLRGGGIIRITTSGAYTFFPEAAPPGYVPESIITGPDGGIWFNEGGSGGACPINEGFIARIDPTSHAVIRFQPPTLGTTIGGLTAGPDGAIWFTELEGNKIGRMTTAGSFTEFTVPTANSQPFGITAGPDGALWFTEGGANKIGRLTTAGVFSEFAIPTASSGPAAIVTGPDGAIWFTEYNGNKIGRITPSGQLTEFPLPSPASNTRPNSIAAGPDGALWFTEYGTNGNQNANVGAKIGRVTVSGVISLFTTPTALSQPTGIAAGPDGAIWFTEANIVKIGRLQIAMNFEGKGYILDASLPAACAADGINPNDEFTVVLKYTGGSVGIPPDTLSFYTEHSGAAATATNASQSLASPGTLAWTYVTDRGFAGNYNSTGTSSMTLLTGLNAAISAGTGNIKVANGVINDFFGYAGCNIQNFHAALVVRPN